ncbi:MAG: TonB-dependent receptor [Dysgonamonadaceae bacterium]|jgi:outer membrane cobalamin receptor|nr:TonB-dependent receptor [Dysgonamonadaceae bacterium]
MNKIRKKKLQCRKIDFRLFLLWLCAFFTCSSISYAQNTYKVSGTVSESGNNGKNAPIASVTVSLNDYSMVVYTDMDGRFVFFNVPEGKTGITVKFLGKETIEKSIEITEDLDLSFVLRDDNFRLEEVVVTAKLKKSGQSTASHISKKAMEHLQANSLADVLSLLPGGLIQERNLNNSSQVNIRTALGDDNMNALGVSVVSDGTPLSNNANLQAFNPTVHGGTAALVNGASPAGGADIRTISMDNIESIEVINGVPSVEYGDVTAGVVMITSKSGVEPLQVALRANQNVYEASAGKGFSLGKKKGTLNVGFNYAHNVKDPVSSYRYYQRSTGKLTYSNLLMENQWRTKTSLDLIYGRDKQDENPDDKIYRRASDGKEHGLRFNTNGTFAPKNGGIFRSFNYTVSSGFVAKDSYSQENYSSANAPYSMTTTNGSVLSNKPNTPVYDENGQAITNISPSDAVHYAVYLPTAYFGQYNIEGREFNLFGKGVFNFFKKTGIVSNRFLVGVDFKSDKNFGAGKTFDPTTPPYRNLQAQNATFRPRKYSDIPAIRQTGLFAEDNFTLNAGDRQLKLQAGLRYDHISVVKGAFSPRLNVSFDVAPNLFVLRGGYGITAKAPTLLYLYPERAYFEYININELTNENIPAADRVFLTTTRVLDTQNSELEVAKNKRGEIGFDLNVGRVKLNVTAFSDRLDNGYSLGYTTSAFSPFTYKSYVREGDHFKLAETAPVLSAYYTPTNNLTVHTDGLEFDLNLGRFHAIRTAFSVNGAWLQTESYDKGYYFYDPGVTSLTDRTHVALYEESLYKHTYERFTTAARITHNVPELGFVITLTGQTIWINSDWYHIGNTNMPEKYISVNDGKVYPFDSSKAGENEFKSLLMNTNDKLAIKETSSPVFCFNVNITKEIGQQARLSFFANNMFRSYPISESNRTPGSYRMGNSGLFTFGVELVATIK